MGEGVTQAMSTRLLFATLLAVGATISSAHNSSAASSTVYIIRHGEKTWGGGCLNIEGQERANNLPNVFNGKTASSHQTFETPTALFANNYDAQPECGSFSVLWPVLNYDAAFVVSSAALCA